MKIVFVHHHMRRGGVTRVALEQIEAVRDVHEVLFLSGEPPDQDVTFPVALLPAIAYDRDRAERLSGRDIAESILEAVERHFSGGADLYHVHNPTLGKNRDIIGALKRLQSSGARLLLHIHDFAEDGRPQNYTGERYPENCHYAVINKRDYRLLLNAGLKTEGLHLLHNPIRPLRPGADGLVQDLILYPVRAIRRKNIGEALLLSLFIPEDMQLGVTLEPTGALDVRSYRDWMRFASQQKLQVQFGLGVHRPFEEVLGRARCMLTTSIKEGFGLVFAESWMGEKPLVGRLLPDICEDFQEAGIRLSHLYGTLRTSLGLFDSSRFFEKWKRCYLDRLNSYGLAPDRRAMKRYLKSVKGSGILDFGMLSEDLQRQAITCLLESPREREAFGRMNPGLGGLSGSMPGHELISHNRNIVARGFSPVRYRERLLDIYESVKRGAPVQSIRPEALLRGFNTPERGNLLLCDQSYDE
jgi:glycosyltransferase involved in cell wall biosynthesis